MDASFSEQDFTEKDIQKIYRKTTKEVHKALPKQYTNYKVRIVTRGLPLESIIEQNVSQYEHKTTKPKRKKTRGWWKSVSYDGKPWVENSSLPYTISNGLQGKHISLWASHGRFYDNNKSKWRWQRPNMFCTNEDLFTQTIVVPFLIPMLEKAGAYVFTPRERDWQQEEVIVDNDDFAPYYTETSQSGYWKASSALGFATPVGNIADGHNPFEKGTSRQIRTTKSDDASSASYQPNFPKTGRYAVYVSYTTLENSIDDALYIVHHQGQRTEFRVNQQMGGGTWYTSGVLNLTKVVPLTIVSRFQLNLLQKVLSLLMPFALVVAWVTLSAEDVPAECRVALKVRDIMPNGPVCHTPFILFTKVQMITKTT